MKKVPSSEPIGYWNCPVCSRRYAVPPGGAIQCFCWMLEDPLDRTRHCPFKTIFPRNRYAFRPDADTPEIRHGDS